MLQHPWKAKPNSTVNIRKKGMMKKNRNKMWNINIEWGYSGKTSICLTSQMFKIYPKFEKVSFHWLGLIRAFLKVGVMHYFSILSGNMFWYLIFGRFCVEFFSNLSIVFYFLVTFFNYLRFFPVFLSISIIKFNIRCCSFTA